MKINITIPAHNEEKILETNIKVVLNLLPTLLNNHIWQLAIVENGSSDKTKLIAQKLADQNSQILYLSLPRADKWSAISAVWRAFPGDIYIFFDADLSTDLKDLPRLIQELNDAELVVGTRHHKDSLVKRSFFRSFISLSYCYFVNLILGLNFSDFQCGFKAINDDAWKKLSTHLQENNWFTDTELLAWAKILKIKTQEIPISWEEKKLLGRKSKLKIIRTGLIFLKKIFQLKKRLVVFSKK